MHDILSSVESRKETFFKGAAKIGSLHVAKIFRLTTRVLVISVIRKGSTL